MRPARQTGVVYVFPAVDTALVTAELGQRCRGRLQRRLIPRRRPPWWRDTGTSVAVAGAKAV